MIKIRIKHWIFNGIVSHVIKYDLLIKIIKINKIIKILEY
jgi:hypothetical protein